MVQIFIPTSENILKNTAQRGLFSVAMQTAKPLKSSPTETPNFEFLKELEGKNWLTSLAISSQNKQIILQECIISVSQEKQIVSTALQGRNGTIKEYISDGDYQISIMAAVSYSPLSEQNPTAEPLYPIEPMAELIELLKHPESLEVQSDFLQLFEIFSVVVTGYSLEQETHSNRQSIQIQMLSDLPYEIQLKDDETR